MNSFRRLRVGIAQTDCKLGDLRHNVQVHLDMIRQARAADIALLVFPELSLTGYGLGGKVPEVALGRHDPLVLEIAKAAGEMRVVFGFVEEGPAAQFYNVAAMVSRGHLIHLHRKLNLPTYGNLAEGKVFAEGERVEVAPLDGSWTAGLLICADLWNPALVHLAMQQKATVLLAPINSALGAVSEDFSNPQGWDWAIRFYAMMYGVPVIMANRVGAEGTARFWGGSCFELPTVRDANLPLVQREINRLLSP